MVCPVILAFSAFRIAKGIYGSEPMQVLADSMANTSGTSALTMACPTIRSFKLRKTKRAGFGFLVLVEN